MDGGRVRLGIGIRKILRTRGRIDYFNFLHGAGPSQRLSLAVVFKRQALTTISSPVRPADEMNSAALCCTGRPLSAIVSLIILTYYPGTTAANEQAQHAVARQDLLQRGKKLKDNNSKVIDENIMRLTQ